MSGWMEVARIAFKGDRFRDHALDLRALSALGQFQGMIKETAQAMWRAAHPERERLPRHFDDSTRLYLRRIDEGSAVAPLETYVEEPEEPELFEEEPVEVVAAVRMAYRVYRSVEKEEPLPEGFPKSLVEEYSHWGESLSPDEAVELAVPGDAEPAKVTQEARLRLVAYADRPHEASVNAVGEVLEVDVRQGRFQLWLDDGTSAVVTFSPEQEDGVTRALRDHRTIRMGIGGRGEYSPSGKLRRIVTVEHWELRPIGGEAYDETAPRIEDVLAGLAREVPDEEWKKLPADLIENLDHYLYGTPKR